MNNWLSETTLDGKLVTLVPLETSHKTELVNAAADGELWDLWFTSIPSKKTIDNYIAFALSELDQQRALPFTVIDKHTGKIIGATRFCNATPEHRRLEIGYTWYAKSFQRSGVNTECKYLLLSHAFEALNSIAVEFRTHWHNLASRTAIARLGAKQDGILRSHQIGRNGTLRDTVVFSILQHEWPLVKQSLEARMNKSRFQ